LREKTSVCQSPALGSVPYCAHLARMLSVRFGNLAASIKSIAMLD
jgi:hypothetical protein